MKQFETKKLFYDEYLYKLVFTTSLSTIFRQKNLIYARTVLDALRQQYDNGDSELRFTSGIRIHYVEPAEFLDAERIYKFLSRETVPYKLRIERSYVSMYSNSKEHLLRMATVARTPKEFWEPSERYMAVLKEPNVIITNTPSEYEYKVTLSTSKRIDPSLAKWLRANQDKSKATERCLETIESNRFPNGQFFYVRDKKVLQLIFFMIDKIGRIDKIVYVDNQDK